MQPREIPRVMLPDLGDLAEYWSHFLSLCYLDSLSSYNKFNAFTNSSPRTLVVSFPGEVFKRKFIGMNSISHCCNWSEGHNQCSLSPSFLAYSRFLFPLASAPDGISNLPGGEAQNLILRYLSSWSLCPSKVIVVVLVNLTWKLGTAIQSYSSALPKFQRYFLSNHCLMRLLITIRLITPANLVTFSFLPGLLAKKPKQLSSSHT